MGGTGNLTRLRKSSIYWIVFTGNCCGLAFLVILPVFVLFCSDDPTQAGPLEKPMLRLDTGLYTPTMNRIEKDRDERLLGTGSHDKTVGIWICVRAVCCAPCVYPWMQGKRARFIPLPSPLTERSCRRGGQGIHQIPRASIWCYKPVSGPLFFQKFPLQPGTDISFNGVKPPVVTDFI